ncbi:MAG: winged helix-turn-helix transcriptional regulator [Gammaproteobacteria bacterium]|nr:winged helix-turn-helix transcriptional regulator [Gammaproteobacteria bacterium]
MTPWNSLRATTRCCATTSSPIFSSPTWLGRTTTSPVIEAALISKRRDPDDGKRSVYALTEKGLDTLPVLLEMVAWGASYDPATGARAE